MSDIGSSGKLFRNDNLNTIMNASRSGILGTADNHGVTARSTFFSGLAKIASVFNSKLQETNKEAKLNLLIALKREFDLDEPTLMKLEDKIGLNSGKPLKMSTAQDLIFDLKLSTMKETEEFNQSLDNLKHINVDDVTFDVESFSDEVSQTTKKFEEFQKKGDFAPKEPPQQKQVDVPLLRPGEQIFDISDRPVKFNPMAGSEPLEDLINEAETMLKEDVKTGSKDDTNFDDIIYGKTGNSSDELGDVLDDIMKDAGLSKTSDHDLGQVINEAEDMIREHEFEEKQDKTLNDDVDHLIYGSSGNSDDELGDLLNDIASGKGISNTETESSKVEDNGYSVTKEKLEKVINTPLWELGGKPEIEEKTTPEKPEKDLSMPGKKDFDEEKLKVDVKDYAPTASRLDELLKKPLWEIGKNN